MQFCIILLVILLVVELSQTPFVCVFCLRHLLSLPIRALVQLHARHRMCARLLPNQGKLVDTRRKARVGTRVRKPPIIARR